MLVEMEWVVQECYTAYEFAATCYGASELTFEDISFLHSKNEVLE